MHLPSHPPPPFHTSPQLLKLRQDNLRLGRIAALLLLPAAAALGWTGAGDDSRAAGGEGG
ncbi:hypothetical protein EMCG_05675 [[Emmonsia] crescens]|uniref:Uncharacterized protein n=1 Tax=[Emmonsia] crescens TaxID=73230 RepID=A0A0G2J7S9_9EURO|nr:hypothetical protein EMCG_05675 [Emmonsia crescens UAMH 3008]